MELLPNTIITRREYLWWGSFRQAPRCFFLAGIWSLCCVWNPFAVNAADSPTPEAIQFFEAKIRPLLIDKCFECHGADEQKGGLRLDSLAAIHAGGESGSAINTSDAGQSLLLEAVRYESLEMPPNEQLRDADILALSQWVEMGAPWPEFDPLGPTKAAENGGEGKSGSSAIPADKITLEDRAWWSYQPLADVEIPQVVDPAAVGEEIAEWLDNPIDAFLYSAMQAQGLRPARPAVPTAMLRRLYFDVLGVPPAPRDIAEFSRDPSDESYRALVDKLLDDPRYGQRWAQHWLDLVRYADSDGYRIDHYRPHAWRYRDYVINALNQDKPYDQFMREQIAGDELYPDSPEAKVATGFLRHWIYEYNQRDVRTQWDFILNDVTDTTSDVFLGMGMQCAKCHDHKFDPILQQDYYRLRAFFEAITPIETAIASDVETAQYQQQLVEWELATEEIRAKIALLENPCRVKAENTAIGRFPEDIQIILRTSREERTPREKQLGDLAYRQVLFEFERLESLMSKEDKEKYIQLKKELSQFDNLRPAALPRAPVVIDAASEAPPTLIPKRSGVTIEPGTPFVVSQLGLPETGTLGESDGTSQQSTGQGSTGRRSQLAKWLSHAENPLTTRTIVNRVWQYHFGRGLAPNASDFGKLGGEPTHPALLDWLTRRFVEEGWSLKKLHRLILTSAAYRQATDHADFARNQQIDPLNRFYWRANTLRLDAGQIRDALISVSGQLDTTSAGEGVLGDQPRRTVYMRVMRNARDPFLDMFDLPQYFNSESNRNITTTPVQSLMLINSPEMLRFARQLADRVVRVSQSVDHQIDYLWQQVYQRPPQAEERKAIKEFLEQADERLVLEQADLDNRLSKLPVGRMLYRAGQALNFSIDAEPIVYQTSSLMPTSTTALTVETHFQIRSVYSTGEVRTLLAQQSPSGATGWSLGVTGLGSRRKPQTLVLQLWGKKLDSSTGEETIFSDQDIKFETPYFVAATVSMPESTGNASEVGEVVFYLKDLSNDDEPLQIARVSHSIARGVELSGPVVIGGRIAAQQHRFDGFIDDSRLSRRVLSEQELLKDDERTTEDTIAYWKFETDPGLLADSSASNLPVLPPHSLLSEDPPSQQAWIDICHAMLNSNEFLYVQ